MAKASEASDRSPLDLLEVLRKNQSVQLKLPGMSISVVLEYLDNLSDQVSLSETVALSSERSDQSNSAESTQLQLESKPETESEEVREEIFIDSASDLPIAPTSPPDSASSLETDAISSEQPNFDRFIGGINISSVTEIELNDFLITYFSEPGKLFYLCIYLCIRLKAQGIVETELSDIKKPADIKEPAKVFEQIIKTFAEHRQLEDLSQYLEALQSSYSGSPVKSVEAHSQQIDEHLGEKPIQVFISYSHRAENAKDRVAKLTRDLEGAALSDKKIYCECDIFHSSTPEDGWDLWMTRQIQEANFVLMVCSEPYQQSYDKLERHTGQGCAWETTIINAHVYRNLTGTRKKFIPVFFSEPDRQYIPDVFCNFSSYCIRDADGVEDLYRHLVDMPRYRRSKNS